MFCVHGLKTKGHAGGSSRSISKIRHASQGVVATSLPVSTWPIYSSSLLWPDLPVLQEELEIQVIFLWYPLTFQMWAINSFLWNMTEDQWSGFEACALEGCRSHRAEVSSPLWARAHVEGMGLKMCSRIKWFCGQVSLANSFKLSEIHPLYGQPSPRLSNANRHVVQPFSAWSDHTTLDP